MMLGKLGTALNSVNLDNASSQMRHLVGLDLENFSIDFTRAMGGRISDAEYRSINPVLERLISTLEMLARQQSTGQTVNVNVID
ncbi:MAG: hypothetical protein LBU00_02840 [Treponema sp.]|jgi:hypothetical protein|nr:hypothetical protein [Treponema sp.]